MRIQQKFNHYKLDMHAMLTNAERRREELAGYPNHSGSTLEFFRAGRRGRIGYQKETFKANHREKKDFQN